MVLHLIKLAVGVDDLAHMKKVQAARRKQRRQGPRSPHWVYTRNTPRRAEELLHGGSLYWVVRGVIRCRQELVGFEEDFDKEEAHKYCRIKVKRTIVADRAARLPAFQGWRYFEPRRRPARPVEGRHRRHADGNGRRAEATGASVRTWQQRYAGAVGRWTWCLRSRKSREAFATILVSAVNTARYKRNRLYRLVSLSSMRRLRAVSIGRQRLVFAVARGDQVVVGDALRCAGTSRRRWRAPPTAPSSTGRPRC